jgi:carbonic anhydrase
MSSHITPLPERNRAFAATDTRKHTPRLPFLPHQGLYIVTCIDPRTDPADFLGLRFAEAIVARTVGGRVTEAVIQDLSYIGYLVESKAPEGPFFEAAIIHHTDCGSGLLADESIRRGFAERTGYDEDALAELPVLEPAATVRAECSSSHSVRRQPRCPLRPVSTPVFFPGTSSASVSDPDVRPFRSGAARLGARGSGEVGMSTATESTTEIRPFEVEIPESALDDLHRRIAATRFPTKELVADRSQGVQLATIQALARYWADEYDWKRFEAKLNALPQFTTAIDGLDFHFVHVRSPTRTRCRWSCRTAGRARSSSCSRRSGR